MAKIFQGIDWKLLAQQKIQLIYLLNDMLDDEKKSALRGVINMIDDLQDEAESLGYPVVWSYDLQCIYCAGDCPVNYRSRSGEVCSNYQIEMNNREDRQLDDIVGLG
jgi:hypothetical protein